MSYYEILGISKNATEQEIRIAYKKKARILHPSHDPNPEKRDFKEMQEAYEVLIDKDKRKYYDKYGKNLKNNDSEEIFNLYKAFKI